MLGLGFKPFTKLRLEIEVLVYEVPQCLTGTSSDFELHTLQSQLAHAGQLEAIDASYSSQQRYPAGQQIVC